MKSDPIMIRVIYGDLHVHAIGEVRCDLEKGADKISSLEVTGNGTNISTTV
jgi:hypothetical protein